MDLLRKTPALLLIIILGLIVSCSEKNEIRSPGGDDGDGSTESVQRPDQQIRGAQIFLYKGSVITTDIQADYIEKFSKRDSTPAWGLNVYFYNPEGEMTSHLEADSGLVRESSNWMVANGNVVVINTEDSARLETEQLYYYGRTETIETDSFVTIYQRGDTLRGYGLKADQGLKRVRIKRQVSGTLQNADNMADSL